MKAGPLRNNFAGRAVEMSMTRFGLILIAAALLAAACSPGKQKQNEQAPVAPPAETRESAGENGEASVEKAAREVVDMLKNKNFEALAEIAHPEKGVTFSPYPYVDTARDVTLSPAEIVRLAGSDERLLWGSQDGSGKPIEMTFREYYDEYIYDAPFDNPDSVFVNEKTQHGNAINNSLEAFDGSQVVEFYLAGTDPRYGGMDWKALRLVFERREDQWRLRAIIHGEWTI